MNIGEAKKTYADIASAESPCNALMELLERYADERVDLEAAAKEFPTLSLVAQLTESFARKLMIGNPEPDVYYEGLWEVLSSRVLLTDQERPLALLLLVGSNLLPYKRYELVTMDDDRFRDLVNRMGLQIGELQRAAHRGFAQKTEEASAVLSVVDSQESAEERVVLLSIYLSMLRDAASR